MKKIFLSALLFLCGIAGYSQAVVLVRGDTIKIYKQGAVSNLVVEGKIINRYMPASDTPSYVVGVTPSGQFQKINKGTLGGGAGNPNSNVGTGYRWAIPHTNNIKTFFVGYGLGIDSAAHANALTLTVDTTAMSTRAYVDTKSFTGNPAGNNTELQFNNSGVFGASSNLVYNGTQFKIGVNNTVFDVATGYISRYANVPPGSGNLLIGDGADSKMKFGAITSPNGSIGIGYNSPNIQIQLDTSLHHTVGYYDMRYGVGGEGANNYTTSSSFTNNTLTMQRNGLGDLTASFDTTRWHTKLYYDGIYGNGGANNYSTATSFTDNVLTTQRNGLGDLTASFDTTKWHTLGYYDGRYGNGSGTNNGNSGSGHRLLYNGTQDLRTLYGGYAMSWDTTTNATGLTVKIDTTQMATRAYAQGYGGAGGAPTRGDSTINVVGTDVSFRDYVNVKTYGAKGNGSDNDKSAIETALAYGDDIFFPPGTYKITGKLDFLGKNIHFARGAKIKGATTDTVLNMRISADRYQQIFDTTISVTRAFNENGALLSVVWFGAASDCAFTEEVGTTDNYPAFRRALLACYDNLTAGMGYYYTRGVDVPSSKGGSGYYISRTLYLGGTGTLKGDGIYSSTLIWPRGVEGIVVTNTSYGNTAQYANPQDQAAYKWEIRELTISGFKGVQGFFPGYYRKGSNGITLYGGSTRLINIHVINWQGHGILIYGANENTFTDVEVAYNAGDGVRAETPDGNANNFYNLKARWSGRFGINDKSFLGNYYYSPNLTTNGGHYLYNRSAVTHGGKWYCCKRDIVFNVTHNGHHYHCILGHTANYVAAEPGIGANWSTYWTDLGAGSESPAYPEWDAYDSYVTTAVEPGVTTGWADYYEDLKIDYEFADNVWDDTTAYFGGGALNLEGVNQMGRLSNVYIEYDQRQGGNYSSSVIDQTNGGSIEHVTQNYLGGFMQFPNISVVRENSEKWRSVIRGEEYRVFGWWNNVDSLIGWRFDTASKRVYLNSSNNDGIIFASKTDPYFSTRGQRTSLPTDYNLFLYGGVWLRKNDEDAFANLRFANSVPTAGKWGAGDLILNYSSDTTLVGWRCTTAGDFSGTPPIFHQIKSAAGTGATTLDELNDVTISDPQANQVLKYSGGQWINADPGGGGNPETLTIQSPLTGGSYNTSSPVTIGLDTAVGKWRSEGYYDTKYAPIGGGGGGSLTEKYIGYGNASNQLTGTADIQREGDGILTIKPSSGSSYLKLNSSILNSTAFLEGIDSSLMVWTNGVRRIWVQGERGVWISRHNPQTMSYTGYDYDLQVGEKAYIPNLVVPTSIQNNGTYLGTNTLVQEGLSADWNETTPGKSEGAIHFKPFSTNNHGAAITFGAQTVLDDATAGIYTRTDQSFGSKMYLATTDNFSVGSKTRIFINNNGHIGIGNVTADSMLHVTGAGHFTGRLRVEIMDSTQTPDNVVYQTPDGTLKKTSRATASYIGVAAAPATSGTVTFTFTNLSAVTITPTGDCTFNSGAGVAGQKIVFIITTSGTTSHTLTWAENFRTTGTLATGTVDSKVFTVSFISPDGTYWYETSRTTAM